eukprot:m.171479 g.171479  ORF g.171479 m.171479 type:complete len:334 (-) comp14813_c0_seq1:4889-5890(-)
MSDPSPKEHLGYLASYKGITSKLKKRFLRTNTVVDAVDQYQQLAKWLEKDGVHQYAAFVTLAAARCDEALNNPTGETEKVVRAAHLFMEAEMEAANVDYTGFEENLMEAVDCYELAIDIYCKIRRTAFAATLRSEVANALVVFGKLEEAAEQYSAAALLLDGSPLPAIAATESVCECKIRLLDYAGALDCLGSVLDTIRAMRAAERDGRGAKPVPDGGLAKDDFWVLGTALRHSTYGSIVGRAEITAVLLLLQLPQAVRDAHRFAAVLVRYRGVLDIKPPPYLVEDVVLLMQSVLQAVEDDDLPALQSVQSELWFPLNAYQNELLYSLNELLR